MQREVSRSVALSPAERVRAGRRHVQTIARGATQIEEEGGQRREEEAGRALSLQQQQHEEGSDFLDVSAQRRAGVLTEQAARALPRTPPSFRGPGRYGNSSAKRGTARSVDRAAEERARAEKQARLERGLVTLQSQLTKLEHEQRALERDQRSVTHAMKAHADAAAAELRRERDAVESTVKARVDEVVAQQSADHQRRTREEKERSEQLKQNLSDLQQQIRNLEIERSPSATGKASTESAAFFSDAPRAPKHLAHLAHLIHPLLMPLRKTRGY